MTTLYWTRLVLSRIVTGDNGGDGYGDGGDGYGGGGDGGDGGLLKSISNNGENMKPGLHLVSLPSGGFYPYTVVAWFEPLGRDEWAAHGARIIRRYGPSVALATLAAKGPQKGTELLPAAHEPPEVHRLHMGLPRPCNEEAWKKECPKPKGWAEKLNASHREHT